MIWTDYSDNRYSPAEGTVLARDKYIAGSGVTIFCHGAESGTGGSYQWMSLPTRQKNVPRSLQSWSCFDS